MTNIKNNVIIGDLVVEKKIETKFVQHFRHSCTNDALKNSVKSRGDFIDHQGTRVDENMKDIEAEFPHAMPSQNQNDEISGSMKRVFENAIGNFLYNFIAKIFGLG